MEPQTSRKNELEKQTLLPELPIESPGTVTIQIDCKGIVDLQIIDKNAPAFCGSFSAGSALKQDVFRDSGGNVIHEDDVIVVAEDEDSVFVQETSAEAPDSPAAKNREVKETADNPAQKQTEPELPEIPETEHEDNLEAKDASDAESRQKEKFVSPFAGLLSFDTVLLLIAALLSLSIVYYRVNRIEFYGIAAALGIGALFLYSLKKKDI